MIGWYGASMLCYVTPKEHLGLPNREDVKAASSVQDCGARGRHRAASPGAREPRRRAFPCALPASTGTASSNSRSTPRPRGAMHDETLPEDGFKDAHFCSMCGPKFCSMNISAKVETFTAEEAAEAANEPRRRGWWGFRATIEARQKAPRRKQNIEQVMMEEPTVAAIGGQRRADFSDLAGGWRSGYCVRRDSGRTRQIDWTSGACFSLPRPLWQNEHDLQPITLTNTSKVSPSCCAHRTRVRLASLLCLAIVPCACYAGQPPDLQKEDLHSIQDAPEKARRLARLVFPSWPRRRWMRRIR